MGASGGGQATARADATAPPHAPGSVADATAVSLDDNPLLPLRRLGVGAALDLAFDLFSFRFRRLVGLAACVVLPVQLLDLALRQSASGGSGTEQGSVGSALLFVGGSSDWVILTIALQALGLSILGICTGYLVGQLLRGQDATFRIVFGVGARRCGVALAIVALSVLIRVLFAFIPVLGLLIGDALVFTASIAAGVEVLGPVTALRRSISLSRGAFGPAMVLSLASLVITEVIRISLYIGPTVLVSFFTPPEGWLVAIEQLAALIQLVVQPLTACIAATSYLLLRARVEGLDLQQRCSTRSDLVDATR